MEGKKKRRGKWDGEKEKGKGKEKSRKKDLGEEKIGNKGIEKGGKPIKGR